MIEANPGEPQLRAITELFLDVGYDALWRTVDPYARIYKSLSTNEFPPGPAYWSKTVNSSLTLHNALDRDLKGDASG